MTAGIRPLLLTATIVLTWTIMSIHASAKELLVFISAFAAGEQGAIHAYKFDTKEGRLKLAHRTTDAEHPFFLSLSRDRRFLYSIHAKTFGGKEHEQVAAYQIVGKSGQLKLLNRQSARGTAACYLDIDSTGQAVLVANYSTGSVASFPVRSDGSLGQAASFSQHKGSSVNPARQKGPHAHCIVVSPDNRYVFAADLGLDQVLAYSLDPRSAKLETNKAMPFARTPAGAGPRHLTFHPSGDRLYVVNEIGNSVTAYDYDSKPGTLTQRDTISTLPPSFKGTSHCADVKITPNGRFLYATNRGHDSIACYRVGEKGRLTRVAITPSLGKSPQNLAITPGGEWLLCANMAGKNVVVFRIDNKTGTLEAAGSPTSLPSPSCIMIY